MDHALEYVREPPARTAHLLRRIGHAPDRRALIFCAEQLFVIPAADIVGFRADRIQPAKGCGGSSLVVECRRPGQAGGPTTIRFASGPGIGDHLGYAMAHGSLLDAWDRVDFDPDTRLLRAYAYRPVGGRAPATGQSSCLVEHHGVALDVEASP